MIALSLAALMATLQPSSPQMGGDAAPAAAKSAPASAALSAADLQRWVDDQPEVRAYEQLTATRGVRPPPADAFRRQPTLASPIACRSSQTATRAAVRLFQVSDQGKITLSEPDLLARNDGRMDAMLNETQKQALQDRAREYEQAAGEFEPACLG